MPVRSGAERAAYPREVGGICYSYVSVCMRLLYVVFIVSIAALLWAAYAIARTVRRHGQGAGSTLNLREDLRGRDGERGPEGPGAGLHS
jgi:hypothetical protein